jgi:hypothetical protein
MMNIDATFEVVKARQAALRLLAGPQPMIPLTDPPFAGLRRQIERVMARLGTRAGVTRPAGNARSSGASA